MQVEEAIVEEHRPYQGAYRRIRLRAPGVGPQVMPGQFVHVRLPPAAGVLLRRPFSVFKADANGLEILYKSVGRGTAAMMALKPGDRLGLVGPLGRGFPLAAGEATPVLVAGGYGMAALYLQARRLPRKGTAFFGGRTAGDILCVDEFERMGWAVEITTQDGSLGLKGIVTDAIDAWLAGRPAGARHEYFACGPNGMLRAVGDRGTARGEKAWLSIDRHMGCGVGACLTCVQKIRTADGGWEWLRVCREGPVFEARDVIWDDVDNHD